MWQDEQTGGRWANLLNRFYPTTFVRVIGQNGVHTESLDPVLLATDEFLDFYVGDKVPRSPASRGGFAPGCASGRSRGSPACPSHPTAFPHGLPTPARGLRGADPRVQILWETGAASTAIPGRRFPVRGDPVRRMARPGRQSNGVVSPARGRPRVRARTGPGARRPDRFVNDPATSDSRSRSAAAGTASPATRWPTARWSSTCATCAPSRSTRRPGSSGSQGGALWEDVDGAAWAHHLAVVGGTFGDTGVAGLTLGGGIGWLSGLAGLHLRQPDPGRARDRGRRAGRGRSRRRSRPALGPARRRRQLRRGDLVRVPGHRPGTDRGRLHRVPAPRRATGPAAAGRGRRHARRTRSSSRPRSGRPTRPAGDSSASGCAGRATRRRRPTSFDRSRRRSRRSDRHGRPDGLSRRSRR